MAEREEQPDSRDEPLAPPSEAVHLPGPSYLPALTALGISLALVGIVISLPVTAAGVVIAVVAIWRWVRETREDIAELPLEH